MIPRPVLQRIIDTAFPHSHVVEIEPLTGGLRNTNLKLRLDSPPEWFVLRICEHDASLCQKELDLFRLIGHSVPVPDVIHAEPHGLQDLAPFTLARYVEGVTFRDLIHNGNTDAIAQAAFSAGETLAAIGRFTFSKSGWLGPGPAVTAPLLEGADPMPRFVDLCLASTNAEQCVSADLRDSIHSFVWSSASQLALLHDEAQLVHCDFSRRNVLVRQGAGRWSVVAVLDWEFAVSASPLIDVGNFLRYERASCPIAEPHFSTGYLHAGGTLPPDWRRVARLIDLAALCESLTHDDLSDTIAAELIELIRATLEDRDPQLK